MTVIKKAASKETVEKEIISNKECVYPSRFKFLNATNGIRPNMLIGLMGTSGCITDDTIIKINIKGRGLTKTIKELYSLNNKFKSGKLKGPINIRSYKKDEKLIGLNLVVDVIKTGIKKVSKLTLENGKSISATLDHKFMTRSGFKKLRDITTNDEIMCDNVKPIKVDNPRSKSRCKYKSTDRVRHHPHAVICNCKREGVIKKIETHRLVYEAYINNLELDEFIYILKYDRTMAKSLKYISPDQYHIHHIDGNTLNNELSNLKKLTHKEHKEVHLDLFVQNLNTIYFSRVSSIKPVGKKETYDIQCLSPYNNYHANGMIVHNSGKSSLLKPIVVDAAITPVLIWMTEETVTEYQIGLHRSATNLDSMKNIYFVEEKTLESRLFKDQDKFLEYFKSIVIESKASIVFIDNLTTSFLYSDDIGPSGQSKSALFLAKLTKELGITIFYIAHTCKKIVDNQSHLITSEDIRGSQKVNILAEYLYILQKFTSADKVFPIIIISKHRHHTVKDKFYLLGFEDECYRFDNKINFRLVNKIFKERDQLGRGKS